MRNISRKTLNNFNVYLDQYQNIHFPLFADFETISYQNMEKMPKYLLPAGFPKSKFLYGFEQLKKAKALGKSSLYLTEGYFDVMSLQTVGLHAVGLLGTTLSKEQIQQIRQAGYKKIILAMDRDRPGRVATVEIGYQLKEAGFSVVEAIGTQDISHLSQIYQQEIIDFKDVNDALMIFEDAIDAFKSLYTAHHVEYEEELTTILLMEADKLNVESCIATVRKFLDYSVYAHPELILRKLEYIQEKLGVSHRFIDAVIVEELENVKEQIKMEKEVLSNVALEKGKLLENGSGVFTLNLAGIRVNNIFVTDNDKHGIFVNMPRNKGKDEKYYPQIRLGNKIKDKVNFAIVQAHTEMIMGREFEERQLPINLNDSFNIYKERLVGQTTMFNLQHEDFLIMNMRHVKNEEHNFITFEQHLDADGKYRSHFYATKEKLKAIKESLQPEKTNEQEDDQQTKEFELE